MGNWRVAAITALMTSLLLHGCGGDDERDGGSSDSSRSGEQERSEPSNPVDVLRKIDGCNVEPGVEVGESDIEGNLYASCTFDNNGSELSPTEVTVRTYGADPMVVADPDQLRGDDTHKKIVGGDWVLTIMGDWSGSAAHIDPVEIAEMVGGEYLAP